MLVWLFLLHHVAARETPHATYVMKYVERCPDQGYFFKRDLQNEAVACYLCFCKENGTAVCWPTKNKKCDAESYQHNWETKKLSRSRRSPFSFSDIFVKDATRDVLNSNAQQQCKPHEASKSEGCPPVDWCLGCTVCDCNINGRWDCHLLSFCTEDDKKKKQINKMQQLQRTTPNPSVRRANRQMAQKAVQQLAEKMAQERQKKKIGRTNSRRYFFKNGTLVNKTMFDLRKRKKSPTIVDKTGAEVEQWNAVNMKIRKIPDQITRQMIFDKQQNNAKKVSESANYLVRKMPNKKTQMNIERKKAAAVNVLAKREPNRKKKRQVILPSFGFKIPKELLDKIPSNLIPQRDPPGDHFPKKSHVKRVLPNEMVETLAKKPSRQVKQKNKEFKISLEPPMVPGKKIVKRSTTDKKNKNPTTAKKNITTRKAISHKKVDRLSLSQKTTPAKTTHKISHTTRTDPPKKTNKILKKMTRSTKEKNKKRNVDSGKNNKENHFKAKKGKIYKSSQPKSNQRVRNTKKADKKVFKGVKDHFMKIKDSADITSDTRKKGNDIKSNNNQKNKLSKTMTKQGLRKNDKNNKNINKKQVRNKNNKKKGNIHSKTNTRLHNKPLAKLKPIHKVVVSDDGQQVIEKREKRSENTDWSKKVQEGESVTNYIHKREVSNSKNVKSTSKLPLKKPAPKVTNPKIDQKRINKEIQKMSANIATNLNRKVFEAVERMIGQTLRPPTKKVKRSAILSEENKADEMIVDFPTKVIITPNSKWKDSDVDKLNIDEPFLEFMRQKMKRSATIDKMYNTSHHIPFIMKNLALPSAKLVEKRDIDLKHLEEKNSLYKARNYINFEKVLTKSNISLSINLNTTIIPTVKNNKTLIMNTTKTNHIKDFYDIHTPTMNNIAENYDIPTTLATVNNNKAPKTNSTKENIALTTVNNNKAPKTNSEEENSTLTTVNNNKARKTNSAENNSALSTVNNNKAAKTNSAEEKSTLTTVNNKKAPKPNSADENNYSDLVDIYVPITKKIVKIDTESKNSTELTVKALIADIAKKYIESVQKINESSINAVNPLRKIKRSVSIMKKVITKRSIENKQNKESQSIPIKKTKMVSVDKSNKVKLRRHKRNANKNQSATINLDDVESEISAKSLNVNISKKSSETTDSDFKYYKYTLDVASNADNKSIDTEIEVYTKNGAAKRSVDNQKELNLGVLQIAPRDSNNETVFLKVLDKKIEPISNENKSVISLDDQVNLGKLNAPKSTQTNFLDDKVVVIKEQNNSSAKHLTESIPDSVPILIDTNNFKPNSDNMTATRVKKIDNQNKVDEFLTTKLNATIEFHSSEMVDTTVVIINNQNNSLISTISPLKFTSDPKIKLDNKTNIKNIDSGHVIAIVNVTEKTLSLTNINKLKNDVIVRENEWQSQKSVGELKEDRNRNRKNNNLTSKHIVDNNVTKEEVSSFENVASMREWSHIPTTILASTEQIRNKVTSTSIPTIYNNLKHNSTQMKLQKDTAIEKIKEQLIMNETENLIDQKDRNAKIQVTSQLNNITLNFFNHNIKNVTSLNVTDFNNKQLEDSLLSKATLKIVQDDWFDQTTLRTNEQSSTIQVIDKLKKNMANVFEQIINNTDTEKKKLKSNEMKKINVKKGKKHKLKKLLTTLYNKKNKDIRIIVNNDTQRKDEDKFNKIVNKTDNLKNFFKKILSAFKFNKHAKKPSNIKRFKILKYLQKFFKKILSENGPHKKNKTNTIQLSRKNVIETLCSTFGPCNMNIKNKAKLQSQIDHLNSETYKMLRSVKIIKGLLKLIDIENNHKNITNNKTKTGFKNDVQKLQAILKDTYSNGEQFDKLTETQKLQIQYVKNSTQNFIQSAAKFTMVLNDIVNIITVPEHKHLKKGYYQIKVNTNDKMDTKNILKSRNMNKSVTFTEPNESLQKLKELISKYSLVQNTFMRKIFNIITRLDGKEANEIKNKLDIPQATKNPIIQNNKEEIQVYTKNIIQNLRKLKNLAQNLNGNVRRKRDLRNDDSSEYFLMLMEYLLKQQKPLETTAVNDGIDLILEAIKNAPSIKPIKKKVLPVNRKSSQATNSIASHGTNYAANYVKNHGASHVAIYEAGRAAKYAASHATSYANKLNFKETTPLPETKIFEHRASASKDYSESNSTPTKEDNSTSSNSEDIKLNAVDLPLADEDEEDDDDYALYRKRAYTSSTVRPYSTLNNKHTNVDVRKNIVTETYYHTTSEGKTITHPPSNGESNNEFVNYKDVEDEAVSGNYIVSELDLTSSTTEKTQNTDKPKSTTPKALSEQMRMRNSIDDDISASKSRIDWLDETYEEEIKAETRKYISTTKKPLKTQKTTETYKKNYKKINDISGFSNEIHGGVPKKSSTREILHKKDMNLLNSLDYGTEKTETDVSSSRESGTIDKYTDDAFVPFK